MPPSPLPTTAYNPPGTPSTGGGDPYTFPADLVSDNRNLWMEFQFYNWTRSSTLDGGSLAIFGSPIYLPMPKNIVDHQEANWEAESLGPMKPLVNGLLGMSPSEVGMAAESALWAVIGSTVGEARGQISNPFLTMLYKGPFFKHHRFSWLLPARNSAESDAIGSICNLFKQGQLPEFQGAAFTGATLTYPKLLEVKFSDPAIPYLYTFKPCVVKSVNVDYAAAGQPSFFITNQAPALVALQLEIWEVLIWTQSDYA